MAMVAMMAMMTMTAAVVEGRGRRLARLRSRTWRQRHRDPDYGIRRRDYRAALSFRDGDFPFGELASAGRDTRSREGAE
jgi:hypothetical protein